MSRRWLALAAKAAITALLFWVLLSRTPVEDIVGQMRKAGAPVLGACVIGLFALYATTALRWMVVLRHLGAHRDFLRLWHHTVVAGFFNQFLPSGLGGDALRIWYVRRPDLSLGRATASVIVDRVIALLALFAVVVIGVPYLLAVAGPGVVRDILLLIATALAIGIASFLRVDILAQWLRRAQPVGRLERRYPGLQRAFEGVERTGIATRRLLQTWPDGAIALGLSILNQLVVGVIVWALARAIGADLGLGAALFLFPYVLLLSMVPISLAGWGVREGAMVVVFAMVALPTASALTVSILFGACLLASALPGALLWFYRQSGR